jgi:inner membrane protein
VLSTLYLAATVGIKLHVNDVARASFAKQGIQPERFISTPTLLNTILWRVTADVDSGFYVGYHSLLDTSDDIEFSYLPKNDSLLQPVRGTDAFERLLWFSRGYYVVSEAEDEIRFADIRFGTLESGNPDSREFVFRWRLAPAPADPQHGSLTQLDFREQDFGSLLDRLWQRLLGK